MAAVIKNPGFRTHNRATQAAKSRINHQTHVYSPVAAEGWSTNKELDNSTTQYESYEVNKLCRNPVEPNGTDVPGLAESPQLFQYDR